VVCVAIKEETAPELEGEVDEIHWLSLGQLGRAIAALKDGGAREAVMAGRSSIARSSRASCRT
jgi:hypothetical protein